ncbi:MAG: MerR family transcriptional regulator [Anaerolineales bacterium]|nr:MerR family transcriptional regulator [Anaerolineales bacterium]MCA9930008.1 MerR family transcriptional regulator [Anaerolineales bacterium]
MFKIGDFSQLGQVSTRMLRHYDKLGLLVPSHVDKWTGYRYYTIDQLASLHRIIALKELGLSLGQITELLQEGEISAERLRGMLIMKQAEIEQEIRAGQMRLAHVEARLQQIEQQGQPIPYEVVVKPVAAQAIASIRQIVPFGEMDGYCASLHRQLYQGLREHNIKPLQPELIMYHNDEYEETELDVEMAVPVAPQYLKHLTINGEITFRELPAHDLMAALIYEGPFGELSPAILALLAWIGMNGYTPLPPLRELRLSGPAHVDGKRDPAPVLELQVPIQKISHGD